MSDKIIKCSICAKDIEHKIDPLIGDVYWTQGNNAQPVNAGRCCESCDCRVVIPTRMGFDPRSKKGRALGNQMYAMRMNPPTLEGDEE